MACRCNCSCFRCITAGAVSCFLAGLCAGRGSRLFPFAVVVAESRNYFCRALDFKRCVFKGCACICPYSGIETCRLRCNFTRRCCCFCFNMAGIVRAGPGRGYFAGSSLHSSHGLSLQLLLFPLHHSGSSFSFPSLPWCRSGPWSVSILRSHVQMPRLHCPYSCRRTGCRYVW